MNSLHAFSKGAQRYGPRHSVTLTELQHTRIQYRLVAALLAWVQCAIDMAPLWSSNA